jgi:hypothetical protein
VSKALTNYKHREGMVDIALNALIHLVNHSQRNKLRLGGVDFIQKKLEEDEEVKISGSEIIKEEKEADIFLEDIEELEISGMNVEVIKGIFPTIFEVAKRYQNNENIAENVIKIFLLSLNSPTSSDHNTPLLTRLRVLSLTVDMIYSHQSNDEIIRLGCGLILLVKHEDIEYTTQLIGQLDGQGKASPQGSFEKIASAWKFEEIRELNPIPIFYSNYNPESTLTSNSTI